MNISWEGWKTFWAALAAGSCSAAAESLGIGQATVSRRIAQMEEAVGVPLFERSRGGLAPTPAAERLRPYAQAMAAAAEEGRASLAGFEVEPEGIVRLVTPPGVGAYLLPPFLPALSRKYPKLTLELVTDSGVVGGMLREADIAVRSTTPPTGNYLVRKIADAEFATFASAAYEETLPPSYSISDVDFLDWGGELTEFETAAWLRGKHPRRRVLTSSNSVTLTEAARAGLGAVILPVFVGRVAGLRQLGIDMDGHPTVPFYLVTHRALRRVPRIAAVTDFLLSSLEDLRRRQ